MVHIPSTTVIKSMEYLNLNLHISIKFCRDRIWKLRIARLTECTISNVEALDRVQATFMGAKVVGMYTQQECGVGAKFKKTLGYLSTVSNADWISKSRTTTNSFKLGLTVGFKFTFKKTIFGIGGEAEASLAVNTEYGYSSAQTEEQKNVVTYSEQVKREGTKEFVGPVGGKDY